MATETRAGRGYAPNLVRWGAVFSGVVIGVATFVLLTTLWLALSFSGTDVGWIHDNLRWWIGGTAIFAMFLAGLVAGLVGGVRGVGTGLGNGATVWGLLTIVAVTIGVPSALSFFGSGTGFADLPGNSLWTGFWSLLIGLGAAGVGGMLGGLIHRPVTYAPLDTQGVDERERDRPEHRLGPERRVETVVYPSEPGVPPRAVATPAGERQDPTVTEEYVGNHRNY